jgi:hypothetical protein
MYFLYITTTVLKVSLNKPIAVEALRVPGG